MNFTTQTQGNLPKPNFRFPALERKPLGKQ
jgi:hypothetical protein